VRAVLDSNVFLSAILTPHGSPGRALAAWRNGDFQLVVSAALLDELTRVLAYPKIVRRTLWSPGEQEEFVRLLRENALEGTPTRPVTISRDPADDHVLEAALAGQADYVVTGDRDLLVLSKFEEIPIVTPARFLTVLEHFS
jgi:putative PIN family toxin of toxin-antitoxin system